jgi:hypothetical protein
MRYHVLACDYDGTIAHHGRVDDETIAALGRLRDTGRRLILVTGRELQDVLVVCPRVELFDRVVAENGAVVYCPATRQEKLLAEPPPEPFVRALRERGVSPIAVGRVIVATWKPHETTVLEVIRDLGLELHVTFNKDAVMVLPAGLSKATGSFRVASHWYVAPVSAVTTIRPHRPTRMRSVQRCMSTSPPSRALRFAPRLPRVSECEMCTRRRTLSSVMAAGWRWCLAHTRRRSDWLPNVDRDAGLFREIDRLDLVTQIFTSWNQIGVLLRRLEALRQAA